MVPVASGAQLVKIDKAFRELVAIGLVPERDWKVFGAQAAGCAPVAAAFRAGHDLVQPVRPATLAKSLAIGNPADGPYVLNVVRRTGGAVADVTDAEIVESIGLLAATEGIFGETAVGVTLAVLRRLLADGQLDPDAETVLINSGDGLKTLDAVAGTLPAVQPIRPSLAEFEAALAAWTAVKRGNWAQQWAAGCKVLSGRCRYRRKRQAAACRSRQVCAAINGYRVARAAPVQPEQS